MPRPRPTPPARGQCPVRGELPRFEWWFGEVEVRCPLGVCGMVMVWSERFGYVSVHQWQVPGPVPVKRRFLFQQLL